MRDGSLSSAVEVRTSPLHGRGLFATRMIPRGTEIGVYPLLVLPADETETLKSTRVYHYVFYVDENETGAIRAAIAFGLISMCNHSPNANAVFDVDGEQMTVALYADRQIDAGEEVLIDYEDFAEEAL